MATTLADLFDPADLQAAIAAGHVRMQQHPELPLRIYNYTETCQWESAWTPVTRACRGLIVNERDEVIARPFTKVHNHHEPSAPTIDVAEPVQVTDKVDGSLGILYPVPGGYAVATRGSFASDQAIHATKVWRDRYADSVAVPDGVTPLFEIVYPENRIVVDYGDTDDLVLLAGVSIADAEPFTPDHLVKLMWWPGPVVESFDFPNYGAALAAAPRDGMEGFVVRSLTTGSTVKVKQADYVELHRIVTGLNARTVWERLGSPDGDVRELIESLPDEFHGWVGDVASTLADDCRRTVADARAEHDALLAELPKGWERKDYAMVAKARPARALLFLLLDDRDPTAMVWKSLRPSADWRPSNLRAQTEDAA